MTHHNPRFTLPLYPQPLTIPSVPLSPTHHIPPELSQEPRRLHNRQNHRYSRTSKNPQETYNNPRSKETLAENIVAEKHGHRDQEVHEES